VRRTRAEWWRTVGNELDYLFVTFHQAKAPVEVEVQALRDFERRFLQEARSDFERRQLRRLTARANLTNVFLQFTTWKQFGPHLRRVQRVGYTDLSMRVHVACLYVQSLPSFPERAREAFTMLADAERRVLRLPKDGTRRMELLRSIAHACEEAARYGVVPPQER
jgi:hypothetical protein